MVVAYEPESKYEEKNDDYLLTTPLHKRNITLGVGCSCVLQHSHKIKGFIQTHFNKRNENKLDFVF